MSSPQRPYVDFQQAKRVISVPDVLDALGILDRFRYRETRLSGVCPLPQHQHGPYPNPQQFKAEVKDGLWLWHCFGDCQQGGDSIELARLLTGLDHAHLRLWLADHFGERLTTTRPKRPNEHSAVAVGSDSSDRAVTTAHSPISPGTSPGRFTCASSDASGTPQTAQTVKPLRFHLKLDPDIPYLHQRGLTAETIEAFGLGLCSRGLLEGYVAIPVYRYPKESPDENPVAYLGRWPSDDYDEAGGRPRYKWPPGFPKHEVVYGLGQALETPPQIPLIVVEGVFSVYHLVQCGFPNAVAIFGSSLSDEQAALLVQTGRPIVLMFDGDEAGVRGMDEARCRLEQGAFVRIVRIGQASQPDKYTVAELADRLGFIK